MIFSKVSEFDFSADRAHGYARILYLALYEFSISQLRVANSDDSHLITPLRIVPMLMMRQLSETFLKLYTEQNKKLVNGIRDQHVAILAKIDEQRKNRRTFALDDSECNAIMESHHILQLKKHVSQTRCLSFAFKVCCALFVIANATLNPLYLLCLYLCIQRLDYTLEVRVTRPYREHNRKIRQALEENHKVIRNFIQNKNIIYECAGEDAFLRYSCLNLPCRAVHIVS